MEPRLQTLGPVFESGGKLTFPERITGIYNQDSDDYPFIEKRHRWRKALIEIAPVRYKRRGSTW